MTKRYAIPGTVSIGFVDAREMQRLNALYRGHNTPTDVLSFRLEARRDPFAPSQSKDHTVGELILCPVILRKQAAEHTHSVEHECTILVIHGTLHLYGYDHKKEAEARVMEAGEAWVLRELMRRLAV